MSWTMNLLKNTDDSTTVTMQALLRLKEIVWEEGDVTVTYDFESLYSFLEIEPVCLVFYRFLLTNTAKMQLKPTLLRDLAYLVTHMSYFTFLGVFYLQKKVFQ